MRRLALGAGPVLLARLLPEDAVKNAIRIREANARAQVVILYRDVRTYGLREDYYRRARELGVLFVFLAPDSAQSSKTEDRGARVQRDFAAAQRGRVLRR